MKTDGKIACWGDSYDNKTLPPPGTFIQVSAAGTHACGLRTNATVACWGENGFGEAAPPAGTFTQISAASPITAG